MILKYLFLWVFSRSCKSIYTDSGFKRLQWNEKTVRIFVFLFSSSLLTWNYKASIKFEARKENNPFSNIVEQFSAAFARVYKYEFQGLHFSNNLQNCPRGFWTHKVVHSEKTSSTFIRTWESLSSGTEERLILSGDRPHLTCWECRKLIEICIKLCRFCGNHSNGFSPTNDGGIYFGLLVFANRRKKEKAVKNLESKKNT